MTVTEKFFGTVADCDGKNEKIVNQFIMSTSKGVNVKLISYGASVSGIELPDRNGISQDVTLGFDNIEDYQTFSYIGSTIGRVCGRIKNGKFVLNAKEHQLGLNANGNHLHGGERGWGQHVWDSFVNDNTVTFSLFSQHGDEGYPGSVLAQVSYSLSEDGSLRADFQAISTKATPVNMTNHAFFNLAGHAEGRKGILEHTVQVNSDEFLQLADDLTPTGVVQSVVGSPFDLRKTKSFDCVFADNNKGLDLCFCLKEKTRGVLEHAATFFHPPSGRCLEVFTTEPGLQIYTGNFLPKGEGSMLGRGGVSYQHQGAFCCEAQNFPDAVNHESFPNSILNPGDFYKHSIVYKFTTLNM